MQRRTAQRIQRFAEANHAGQYTRLDVRFRGQFFYVDAYTDARTLGPDWPPPDWRETRAEYQERPRDAPTHPYRLRCFGDEERWGFAFFTYSNEKYSLSVFTDGEFPGPSEEAFRASSVYLAA